MDNCFLIIWLEANVARHSETLCRTSSKQHATMNGGTWIEKTIYNFGDTIVFKKNNTIELYPAFKGWKYNVISNDSILFSKKGNTQSYGFHFEISNNELTITDFLEGELSTVFVTKIFIKSN